MSKISEIDDSSGVVAPLKKICFIVVSYFSHEKVGRLIQSIPIDDHICGVIVDNSVDPDEFKCLEGCVGGRKDIHCISAERNGGFSYGTNIGLRYATEMAESFLLLNPDTVVSPSFFETMLAFQQSASGMVVSPKGIRMDDGQLWSAGGKFFWLRGRADVSTQDRRAGVTSFGTCACILFSNEVLKDVGFLDEDFFLGGEEWDFSMRLKRARWPIIYLPKAKYIHEISGTHEKYGKQFFYMGMRTKVLFTRKYYGILFWPWLLFIMLPFAPVLICRNKMIGHGTITELTARYFLAVYQSAMKKPISESDFLAAA